MKAQYFRVRDPSDSVNLQLTGQFLRRPSQGSITSMMRCWLVSIFVNLSLVNKHCLNMVVVTPNWIFLKLPINQLSNWDLAYNILFPGAEKTSQGCQQRFCPSFLCLHSLPSRISAVNQWSWDHPLRFGKKMVIPWLPWHCISLEPRRDILLIQRANDTTMFIHFPHCSEHIWFQSQLGWSTCPSVP